MNVSHTIDAKNNGVITVEIAQADFADKVEKALTDYRKRASVPGFRPGMAPMAMIPSNMNLLSAWMKSTRCFKTDCTII